MKEYLTIGELAQIFNMDVQLLRYYDSRGLLVPARRNELNGRRFYHFDQIYALATIRYLRKLGYSLDEIASFVQVNDVDKNLDSMTRQADALQRQVQELTATVEIIQKKLRFIQEEQQYGTGEEFWLRTYPERYFLQLGEELNLFTSELFYFYPTVGFYEGERKWFGAYLFGDDAAEQILAENRAIAGSIPAGTYLCSRHRGTYQTIQDSSRKLLEEGCRRGLRLDSVVITPNIIDQFSEGHPSNYLTGLEVRVLPD